MKTIYSILTISLLAIGSLQAQNEADALRYSQNFFGGTARSLSMAGAFGALGGDFSSVSLNPAGLGVYRSTELTFTPAVVYDNTESNYLGKVTSDNNYRFMLNNLGFVHTNLTGEDKGWVGVSFGLGYNQLASFNRTTNMRGIMLGDDPGSSSLLDNFTNWANDTPGAAQDQSLLDPFYEGLAWETYMLELDSLGFWNELWNQYYGQSQQRRIMESGGIGEYAISVGANYGNRLYFGATFGIHRLRYTSEVNHRELDDAQIIDYFDSFVFRELLDARGTGYTFKAGVIFRPISLIRLGAAFHIPTFYKIRESFYTDMQSTFDPEYGFPEEYLRSPVNEFDYWLRTPWRAIGSAAVQLGRIALISADYEYMDYSKANFDSRSTDYNLLDQNDRIAEVLGSAHNIRLGAELHFGPMYLRGGASYYDSPFAKTEENSDAHTITYNGGIGFRSKSVYFDLAYALRMTEYKYYLYIPEDVNGATIASNHSTIAATLGFRF